MFSQVRKEANAVDEFSEPLLAEICGVLFANINRSVQLARIAPEGPPSNGQRFRPYSAVKQARRDENAVLADVYAYKKRKGDAAAGSEDKAAIDRKIDAFI